MRYESESLFIGLVSFPFYVDGKELYENVFQNFFQKSHRANYLEKLSKNPLAKELYCPSAYRMFGSYGLAILSLIDDYAFCSRIFNSGHIRAHEEYAYLNKYKSIILAGSSESDDGKANLLEIASNTFLCKGEKDHLRYPFIGIIRIKLDYRLLKNAGADFTRAIKRRINDLKDELKKDHAFPKLEGLALDSYDNDELFVVAFSDSLRALDSFFKNIRRMQLTDLDIANEDDYDPEDLKNLWHVCAASHMSFGYHIDFSFLEKDNPTFLEWNKKNDFKEGSHEPIYEINCLIETKPGHRNSFCNYLTKIAKPVFGVSDLHMNKTVSGGSIVHIRIPLDKTQALHDLAKGPKDNTEDVFRRDVRRIKLTLNESGSPEDVHEDKEHRFAQRQENLITQKTIIEIKEHLLCLGVSKIVRERLLSLIDVYNDCGRDQLQSYYFAQLKPAVENIKTILSDFKKNTAESLLDIESRINEEISALETALYNRMNNKMSPNTVLEYGGGIQQFLQAFGFAYKEIVRVLSPSEAEKNYSLITGVCKEASMRTHSELNINHILYPQLFCVTTWKEASNFSLQLLDEYTCSEKIQDMNDYMQKKSLFDIFKTFIQNKSAMDSIIEQMLNQTEFVRTDPIYDILYELLTPKCIKYSLLDYILYHFAFNRNYQLMWRFYLKVFLQTPSVYQKKGEIKRTAFCFELLRLFLVAFRVDDDDIISFIKEQRHNPFDYVLSGLWFECFSKIEKAAKNICKNLQSYAYREVSEELILHSEYSLIDLCGDDSYAEYILKSLKCTEPSEDEIKNILSSRKINIDNCVFQIENDCYLDINSFASGNHFSPDNTISLLNAFLIAIDNLDREGKDNIMINTLPRDKKGEIDFPLVKELASCSSNILADPSGGFVIPDHAIRKKYNSYRTLLYRTLWDMSYVSSSSVYNLSDET